MAEQTGTDGEPSLLAQGTEYWTRPVLNGAWVYYVRFSLPALHYDEATLAQVEQIQKEVNMMLVYVATIWN